MYICIFESQISDQFKAKIDHHIGLTNSNIN